MEIIRQGADPAKQQVQGECNRCHTVIKFLPIKAPMRPTPTPAIKAMESVEVKPKKVPRPLKCCAANRDGDCAHADCPQLRDNEPHATGRHCPLDTDSEE